MRRRVSAWILPIVCAAIAAPPAHAQRTFKTIGKDFEHGVRDILHVWASPLHADGREWATFAASAALVGASLLIDDDVDRAMNRHPNSAFMRGLEPFREAHDLELFNLGSGKRLQPISGVLYLLGFAFDSRNLRDAGMGCASTQQASILVHHGSYAIISRERPLTANGDQYKIELGKGPWSQHSFYGGHAGNIMGCVTYWNERFDLGAAEPVLYLLAVGVGLGRVADGRHWLSDTITGMLVGHAFGRVIARRARARAEAISGEAALAPDAGELLLHTGRSSGARTVVIGWRRQF
ncbi:MAG TPA: phosphatase PAP2 family protein [Gemmatimonadaceae bacterium]|nr:phosphatase PAP2 family protein [Gemmatimonadaceae bacterium]